MVRILLLSDISRGPERHLLRGLVNYFSDNGGCALFPISTLLADDPSKVDEIIEKSRMLKVDAIFGRWPSIDPEKVRNLKIPVILRTHDKYFPDFPMLTGEHELIGQMGATFFLDKHYNHLAFFGMRKLLWCQERLYGFLEAVKGQKGVEASYYMAENTLEEWKDIAKWICDLPKPVGIVASNDVMGHRLTEMCQETGLKVPSDVSILGVDDDEFLCNISYPKMSSIHLEFEQQGEEIGLELDKMISSGEIYPVRIPIRASGITERESTLRHNIKDRYVKQIVEYIDYNFASEHGLYDLLESIPLTRRAIEKRFKQEMAPFTIFSYLNYTRVQNMCIVLQTTELPIAAIAEKCGFMDTINVGRIFKKYVGQSPRDYRKLLNVK